MAGRLRVGVIGCGLIAQVMHLNYLRELGDRFEITALCDVSEEARLFCAQEYGVNQQYGSWQELLQHPLDAVFVLTSGSHAPIAIAAAGAGLHVLVEKPMCFSVAEARQMISAAERAGTVLMVGYNKRYDPAYLRLLEERRTLRDLRLLLIKTLESPIAPYVQHYNLRRGAPLPKSLAQSLREEDDARVDAAIPGADSLSRWAYRNVLLDSLVHELNAMRGAMGEPDSLLFADIRENGLTAVFKYGSAQCVLTWVNLPVIARYEMEFAFYSPERRVTLSFPSPFLRSMPTTLVLEDGDADSPHASRTEAVTSYRESFKEELLHFHECVTNGHMPVTSGADAMRDIALCEAVVTVHRSRTALKHPSQPAMAAVPQEPS
jgi:predicted dehydrogenase